MSPSARDVRVDTTLDSNPTRIPPPLTLLPNKSCFKTSDFPSSSERSIKFKALTMREYEIVLGNHPNCSDGPALSIGWSYNTRGPIDINRYEKSMEGMRRTRAQMLIPRKHREYLLQDFGFSSTDINESIKEIQRIQKERKETYKGSKFSNVEKAFSGIKKKLSKK